ncbi:MAG: hypothetical protein ACRDXF_10655, partial [Acidimicrobiia bacterium]
PMTALLIALAVVAGLEWRRLALLTLAVAAPLPMAGLVAVHWWRARPSLSMRPTRFCEAVSGELRAGASLRASLETAAVSVEAMEVARRCRMGAPMDQVARAAEAEFGGIGPELGALLAGADGIGVSPAALFDEIGALAMAQVEVAHEVSIASAPARATGAVLLLGPILAIGWAVTEGRLEGLLRQPAQRAAALVGLALVGVGITLSLLLLRRAR